jgi:CHAT domain-containing protein/tetratricopeptide (TPR) repeat protein
MSNLVRRQERRTNISWRLCCLFLVWLVDCDRAFGQRRAAPPNRVRPAPAESREANETEATTPAPVRRVEEETDSGQEGQEEEPRGGYAAVEDLLKLALTRPERLPPEGLAVHLRKGAAQLQQRGQHAAARVLREAARLSSRDSQGLVVELLEQAHLPPGRRRLAARAAELDREAEVFALRGRHASARGLLELSLQIREELYPETRYRFGNYFLAQNLRVLARQLQAEGRASAADFHLKRGLAMLEKRYPNAHPLLAGALIDEGWLLRESGRYSEARLYLDRALTMSETLYPTRDFPSGHADLARSLMCLSDLCRARGDLAEALSYARRSLSMYETLYPRDRYPKGHVHTAASLRNMGMLLLARAEHEPALSYLQRALEMCESLYPRDEYPKGHPDLALSLREFGKALAARGEYHRARPYLRRSLSTLEALYTPSDYPGGHPNLVESLESFAEVVLHLEGSEPALPYLRRALAMCESLYHQEQSGAGHPKLAACLYNLGRSLAAHGQYRQALPFLQRALVATQLLYPVDKYPKGHAALAESLICVGNLLFVSGEHDRALPYLRRAVAACEARYTEEEYPQGHPLLSFSLRSLGALHQRRGENGQALNYIRRAVSMDQALADNFAAGASEVEALNFAATLPVARDLLLSVPDGEGLSAEDLYDPVWRGKAAISRILRRRQKALAEEAGSTGRQLWQELLDTRRELSRLLLAPAGEPGERLRQLRELTTHKEDIERRVARALPELSRGELLALPPHTELVKKLPAGTAFVDLLRYFRVAPHSGRTTPTYLAFVLAPGQPVRRVELGPAGPIEARLAEWRREIASRRSGEAAARLTEQLWLPLARVLPADTHTVLLAPDGDLTRLPWAALPGPRDGRLLVEDYALAVVPHGPFVLDRLTAPAKEQAPGLILTVSGVDYGAAVAPNGSDGDEKKPLWVPLPHTSEEVAAILELGGAPPARALHGNEASPARLLAELPGARWAHLATHGFFADPALRSVLRMDERLYERASFGAERAAPGARNPLSLSGLVLAGTARLPEGATPTAADGILTAEAIASLPLQDLELAVLSACETGLGEVAGGEGVFGLQRAFHLAGARAVVASLWKVDDAATQALMTDFYRNLWDRKLSRLEALRQAQLAMLHSSGRGANAARAAGPERPIDPGAEARPWPEPGAPPVLWAAWVLSGDPGDLACTITDDSAVNSPSPPVSKNSRPIWLLLAVAVLGGSGTWLALFMRRRRARLRQS